MHWGTVLLISVCPVPVLLQYGLLRISHLSGASSYSGKLSIMKLLMLFCSAANLILLRGAGMLPCCLLFCFVSFVLLRALFPFVTPFVLLRRKKVHAQDKGQLTAEGETRGGRETEGAQSIILPTNAFFYYIGTYSHSISSPSFINAYICMDKHKKILKFFLNENMTYVIIIIVTN